MNTRKNLSMSSTAVRKDAARRPLELPDTEANKVILFGGTFDPPHVGHLTMAQLTLEQTGADAVWLIPAPSPPHKEDIHDDSFLWRVKMVDALTQGRDRLHTMAIEGLLPRPSYSIDTVKACQEWYPDVEFTFLLGSDSLAQLHTWQGAKQLVERIHFQVAVRSGFPFDQTLAMARDKLPGLRAQPIEMPLLDVSSTWIRTRLANEEDVCGLVPEAVLDVWKDGFH